MGELQKRIEQIVWESNSHTMEGLNHAFLSIVEEMKHEFPKYNEKAFKEFNEEDFVAYLEELTLARTEWFEKWLS